MAEGGVRSDANGRRFRVWLDADELAVHPARCSAVPFNQVWPGYQRPLEQTEEAYFVTFDLRQASARLKVEVADGIGSAEVRPLGTRSFEVRGNTVEIPVDAPGQFTVEVDGVHHCLHVFANPPFRPEPSDNEIRFGPGVHHAGLIFPASGTTIRIDEGAVVYGMVFAYRADDVTITGRGILDSSLVLRGEEVTAPGMPGGEMVDKFAELGFPERDRRYASGLVAYGCKRLRIEGIVLRDAPLWSLIVRNGCEDVVIDNVKIVGQWRYNSDGIDLCASRGVVVRNSFVRSFDDCMIARGAYLEGEDTPLLDVRVENCVLWCDWGKSLEVWAGHRPCLIRNITFENIRLIHLSNIAIDVTTWFGSADTRIEDITFRDIVVDPDPVYNTRVFQKTREQRYVPGSDFLPTLIRVDCHSLGPYTGIQHCAGTDNPGAYRLRYRNLRFENIRGAPGLPVCFDTLRHPVEITDVALDAVEYDTLTVRGGIGRMTLNRDDFGGRQTKQPERSDSV